MNKINFDSMKKSLTEEDYHKKLLNMKNQGLKFLEEIDKELSNEKKKIQLKRKFFTPINLSISDDEEETQETSFDSLSTKVSLSSLSASEIRVKSNKKSNSSDWKVACHCAYCEGTAAIDCKSYCLSKTSYSSLDDEDDVLYELLAQRYE